MDQNNKYEIQGQGSTVQAEYICIQCDRHDSFKNVV